MIVADHRVPEFEGSLNINLNDQDWVTPTNIRRLLTHLQTTGGCKLSFGTAARNDITTQTHSKYYYLLNKIVLSSAGFLLNPQFF